MESQPGLCILISEAMNMIFSEKLQLLRKNKGLTQEELAEKLSVSRQAVAKWEAGQVYPDIFNLIQISNLMNVSVDYLYHDTYIGGERFAGDEAIWRHGISVYAMNYIGRVLNDRFSGNFLKEALRKADRTMPYRGPEYYQAGEYTYRCKVTGDFGWFQGYEEIHWYNTKVYECLFHGGVLD